MFYEGCLYIRICVYFVVDPLTEWNMYIVFRQSNDMLTKGLKYTIYVYSNIIEI